jgi:hypothetical protein
MVRFHYCLQKLFFGMMVLPYGVIGNTTDFGSVIIGSSPIGVTKWMVGRAVEGTTLLTWQT